MGNVTGLFNGYPQSFKASKLPPEPEPDNGHQDLLGAEAVGVLKSHQGSVPQMYH
jgi:hypothetical protein